MYIYIYIYTYIYIYIYVSIRLTVFSIVSSFPRQNPKGSKELKIISRKGVFVAKKAKIKNIEETKIEIFTTDSFKNHFLIFKKIEFRRKSL